MPAEHNKDMETLIEGRGYLEPRFPDCAGVELRMTVEAAESLDDLLTQGRDRPREMSLSPVEANLRREIRRALKYEKMNDD